MAGRQESFLLAVKALNESHTADNIRENLVSILTEWDIMNKVIAVVTDSASNMIKAVTDLFGKDMQISCVAHKLNLVVESILNEAMVLPILTRVKDIVTFFKQSIKAADSLRAVSNLKLVQSVPTRWNSSYYMIERFLQLVGVIG